MLFSSSEPPSQPAPPSRTSRAQCWAARDTYFGCLERHHRTQQQQQQQQQPLHRTPALYVPGDEPAAVCTTERDGYHSLCMKSWVEHFNKRIVNQQRAAATQAALSSPSRPP
ncbi:hypothetical protein PCANC_06212 [Puccinia coronata f. sp. avenae]|uniref:Uncharacterized protein n=1 Tax=Puccinia coronata f. sp. avenae TaxID=200324 RepID=A0A2N5V3D3_9BASI|nr:hypothetical protein PCANC_06212 [Puccinia coronata f. sp. avenae]